MRHAHAAFIAGFLCVSASIPASAESVPLPSGYAYDFDAVTLLSRGIMAGQNVAEVPRGFEIRLLNQGSRVYHQSFGLWAKNTLANVDSSTKTISGGLILSLTDNCPNPFSLDTTLSTYIPAFNGAKAGITIRQAFSHSSGLADSNVEGNDTLTLQQAALVIANLPLTYGPPGTQFKYGGTSMHAAGAVAEVAGGASWNTLFEQRITAPLGLTQTRFVLTTPSNPRIAGGVESTATEFGIYMEMVRNKGLYNGTRVLSEEAVEQMLTRQTADDIFIAGSPINSADYGVGVWLDRRAADGTLNQAIAAGARGFHSWIDLHDGTTGVFGTDASSYQNLEAASNLIRDAVSAAVASPRRIGDANRDNRVNFNDLLLLAQNYNRPDRLWSQGDFSGEGIVNFDDLLGLAKNYESSAFEADWALAQLLAQTLVPEPGTLALSLALFSARRTRRSLPPSPAAGSGRC